MRRALVWVGGLVLSSGLAISCTSDQNPAAAAPCGAGAGGVAGAGAPNGGAPAGGVPSGGRSGTENAGAAEGGAADQSNAGAAGEGGAKSGEGGSAGDASFLNECGGLQHLVGSKGDACGTCSHLVCASDKESLSCDAGVPNWLGTAGVVVPELNEPRWSPTLTFASDPTEEAGLYRVMLDPVAGELLVSFQAPTDLGFPSNADTIYFGFATDGTGGDLAKGIVVQVNGTGTTDPTIAGVVQQQNYDAATGWSSPLGAPSWLKDQAVWRNNLKGDAAWGINFKVELGIAGLSSQSPFKVFFGMHKQDELNVAKSVDVSTPDPGLNPLLPGTLFLKDPYKWAIAAIPTSTCAEGLIVINNP